MPIAGGVGLEFADRTAVRTVFACGSAWPPPAGAVVRARRHPRGAAASITIVPPWRITDWVSEQSSVVDLNKLAGRLTNERDAERVVDFAADVQRLQKLVALGASTSDLVLTLIDDIGLAGSVASLDANRRGMNRSAQGDDLTAVTHLAALDDDPATFERWMRSQLAVKRAPGGVLLSTVHRVKGRSGRT